MRHTLLAAALVMAALPASAFAQDAEPPRVEIGAQVSGQTGERSSVTWTPRLTVNLSPDAALELSADLGHALEEPFRMAKSGQGWAVHLRQSLWQDGRWQVFGVVGGGVRRTSIHFPGFTEIGSGQPRTFRPSRFVEWGAAAHVGPAVQMQVASRLILRADVRMEFSDSGGLRGMLGAAVPLAQFPAGTRARQRPADSLVNGVAIGGGVGAVTGAVAGALLAALVCENDCAANGVAFVGATTVTGTAIGGLLGAIIDAVKR